MSAKNPSNVEIVQRAIELRLATVRVCLPGKIVSFDADKQLAVVKPLIPGTHVFSDGTIQNFPLSKIHNVPVIFEGTENFYFTYPIQEGDRCEIRFTDRSLDKWLQNGEDVAPEDDRLHDLTDAVCVMGLRDQGHKIAEFDKNRPSMGKKNGPKIAFSTAHIEIGNDWDEDLQTFAARADKVDDRISAIQQKLDGLISTFNTFASTHTHPGVMSGTSSSGTPVPPSNVSSLGAQESVTAEKVKVK